MIAGYILGILAVALAFWFYKKDPDLHQRRHTDTREDSFQKQAVQALHHQEDVSSELARIADELSEQQKKLNAQLRRIQNPSYSSPAYAPFATRKHLDQLSIHREAGLWQGTFKVRTATTPHKESNTENYTMFIEPKKPANDTQRKRSQINSTEYLH